MKSQTFSFDESSSSDERTMFKNYLEKLLTDEGIEDIVAIGSSTGWKGHASGANEYTTAELLDLVGESNTEWNIHARPLHGVIGTVLRSDHDGSTYETLVAAPPESTDSQDYEFKGLDVGIDEDFFEIGGYVAVHNDPHHPDAAFICTNTGIEALIEKAQENRLTPTEYVAQIPVYTGDTGEVTPATRLMIVANLYTWETQGQGISSFTAVLDLLKD